MLSDAVPTSFLRECGEPAVRAVDLTYRITCTRFTVARQCRIYTGFAIEPFRPTNSLVMMARKKGTLTVIQLWIDCMPAPQVSQ